MSIQQKATQIKWSDLKGRAVVHITDAKRVGSVDDFALDPQTREIVGLKFKPGVFSAEQIVPVAAIQGIGADAVTLRLDAEADNAHAEELLKKAPVLTQVLNNGVVTEGGKLVGNISNVMLSLQPLEIVGYEVSEGGIFSKKHAFTVTPQVRYGDKLVIIPDSLLDVFTES